MSMEVPLIDQTESECNVDAVDATENNDQNVLLSPVPAVNSLNNSRNDEHSHIPTKNKHPKVSKTPVQCCCCGWKLCLCASVTIISIIAATITLVAYYVLVPSFAQQTVDLATFEIINGTVFNAGASSLELNCTVRLQNVGMFEATIDAVQVDILNDGIKFAQAQLPSIDVDPSQENFLTISNTLHVTNITHFKLTTGKALQNEAQTWYLQSVTKQKITTKIAGLSLGVKVNLNKAVILPGAGIVSTRAKNVTVAKASKNAIYAHADASFYSTAIFSVHVGNSSVLEVFVDDVRVGYLPLLNDLMPGLNELKQNSLVVERNDENERVIERFLSAFVEGTDQYVELRGPVHTNANESTVIDGLVSIPALAEGSPLGNRLAFGGLVDRVTQDGWDIQGTKKHLRGAYANMQNPLDVPIRIVNMVSLVKFEEKFGFDVKLYASVVPVKTYHCYPNLTDTFGVIQTGPGMVQDNSSVTWVDVEPRGRATFVSSGGPVPGSDDAKGTCMGNSFSCCWAALTAGNICYNNPQLQKNSKAQLTQNYISLRIKDSNITMLVDHEFEITLKYTQTFMPLYFGDQIFQGYLQDGELQCSHFKFY